MVFLLSFENIYGTIANPPDSITAQGVGNGGNVSKQGKA